MSAQLLVRAAGPGVTIQDAGRFGLARFGVTPAGPMDEAAFLTATRAVGATAALEVSLGGVTLEAQGATLAIALAGGAFDARLENEKLPDACVIAPAPAAHGAMSRSARVSISRRRWARSRPTPARRLAPGRSRQAMRCRCSTLRRRPSQRAHSLRHG